ncbi:tumor necrosis factor receptor superfamily member 6-like isoform X2 [Genypterus blacodes]|uniref:tumor necrosis factor receptor superfamily member 6-like isoform X2 n=1 Tax=Genypterus blacodes TaxID=154954 RepID=UPI003F76F6E1
MRPAVLCVISSLLICGTQSYDLKRIFRSLCQDGTYIHEGRSCCLCGASFRLTKHCKNTPDDRTCDPCPPDTYSSHPNAQMNCQPCTSCQHPDDGLEEAERCSRARDAVCRCKQNHYCTNSEQPCKVCLLCKDCGDAGVKEDCTPTSDTVCSEKSGGGKTAAIVGTAAAIVVILVIWIFIWHKKRQFPNVDLMPHRSKIANILGWTVMRDVALRSNMKTAIQNSELNHPRDTHERTLELLGDWIEKQGSGASRALVEALQSSKKKDKEEELMKLLQDKSNGPHSPAMKPQLPDVDLTPHLTDIANILGWMVMRDVALRSDMKIDIENSELNHPSDAHERTLELLGDWIEKQGSGASRALVEALQSSKKKDTKEKLMKLLQDISNRSNSPA